MSYVYLGLFQSICDWVFDHILDPIVKWLGGILNKLMTWAVNTLIIPAVEKLLLPILKKIGKTIYESLAGVIYQIFAKLLDLLNNLNAIFDTIIGLSDVKYKNESMKMIDIFFRNTSISKLFWYMTFIGFALCLLFAIVAVARSAFDLDFEGKKPVSRVLSLTLRAMVLLFTMEFFVYFVIRLSGAVLMGISAAVNNAREGSGAGTAPTLGGIIFAVASLKASRHSGENLPASNVSITDARRRPYYDGTKSFLNIDEVKAHFDFAKFDYVVGFLVAIFLIIVMSICLIIFVRRLFDLVVLYVLSPFFVSTYPLDDGERFAKWRDQFMGKAFSGFGMAAAMKLYLILVPLIMESGITFSGVGGGKKMSPEFDYFVKIFFLAGGAWAILKAGPMITSLISESAGAQESQDVETGKTASLLLGGALISAAGSLGGKLFGSKEQGGEEEEKSGEKGGKESANGQFKGKKDTSLSFHPAKNPGNAPEKTGSSVGAGALSSVEKGSSGSKAPGSLKKPQGELISSGFFGLRKTYRYNYTDENGIQKTRTASGWDFGLVKFGAMKEGTGFKIPFAHRTYGADGKLQSHGFNALLGGMSWKTGADGVSRFDGYHILGFKAQRDEQNGEFRFRGNALLGLKREKNEKGEYEVTRAPFLWNKKFSVDEDTGEKRLSTASYLLGLHTAKYDVNPADGQSYQTSSNWLGGLVSSTRGVNQYTGQVCETGSSIGWGISRKEYAPDMADGQMHLMRQSLFGRELYVNEDLRKKQDGAVQREDK